MHSFRFGQLGKAVLSTLLLSALTACGGGGGSSNNSGGTGGGGGTVTPPPTLSRLTLTGTVTDAPIANAVVTATIGSQTFTATADANGNYSVEISVEQSATGGFITLTAKGAGSQSYVEFTSLVGAFDALKTQAGSDSILSNSENFATQITNVSTALAVLLKEANGGQPVTTQALIDTLSATLNGQDLIELAAAIKLLVDEADDYPMPSGESSLQALLADTAVREELVTDFYLQNPAAFKNAQNAIVNDSTLTQPVTAATLPSTLTAASFNGDIYTYTESDRAITYTFNPNGTGMASTGTWHRNMTWSIAGASVDVSYESPVELTAWEPAVCPESGFGYELAEYAVYYTTQGAKLTQLNKQLLAITETRDITGRDCGTFDPFAPNEVVTVARTILGDEDFQPIDIAELRNSTRTLWIYNPEFYSDYYPGRTLMPDLAHLNADGTGTTRSFGKSFNWSLDSSGRVLNVTFADGITAKFRSLRELNDVATDVLYEFTLPTGRRVDAGPSLRPDAQAAFTSDNVLGRHYVFGVDTIQIAPGAKGSRMRFDAGGIGSREVEVLDNNGGIVVRDSSHEYGANYGFHWNIAGDELVLQYTSNNFQQFNCDLNTPPCMLTDDAHILPLAREGTRTYWFESWRSGLPSIADAHVSYTLIRYYDYEPFAAPAVVNDKVSPARKKAALPRHQPALMHR